MSVVKMDRNSREDDGKTKSHHRKKRQKKKGADKLTFQLHRLSPLFTDTVFFANMSYDNNSRKRKAQSGSNNDADAE